MVATAVSMVKVGVPEENITWLKSAKQDGAEVGEPWRLCRRKDR